jgi:hypothetical protein
MASPLAVVVLGHGHDQCGARQVMPLPHGEGNVGRGIEETKMKKPGWKREEISAGSNVQAAANRSVKMVRQQTEE